MRTRNLAALLLLFVLPAVAQPPAISFQLITSGLSVPVDVVSSGDGSNRLYVAQQDGLVRIWNGTTLTDFLDIGPGGEGHTQYGGERGLLSIVFHPNYDTVTNRYFFVYYTDPAGDINIRRYQTVLGNSNLADINSDVLIINIPHPFNSNHNGGKLNFGPDGYLYFATGDGGAGNDPPNNAQNGLSLLGKMIRIDIDNTDPPAYPNYSVPASNPFLSDPNIDDRIWDLGLRNPFRWSFDRANGNMWIGDVGQGAQEEIDFRPAGSTGGINFGWRCYEGYPHTPSVPFCDPPNYVQPVYDYANTGGAAVTGGYVYRGPDYPAFRGYYMAMDVYTGVLHFLWPNGSGGFNSSTYFNALNPTVVVGFGEGEDGTLYAVSQNTGGLYKVVASGGTPLPVKLESFTLRSTGNGNQLYWTTVFEQNTDVFHIEQSLNGTYFSRIGSVPASRKPDGDSYTFFHAAAGYQTSYYRLAIQDDDGSLRYSGIVKAGKKEKDLKIYPSVIGDGKLQLFLSSPANRVRISNAHGSIVYERSLTGQQGQVYLNLPFLSRGLYIVQIIGDETTTGKIMIE